MTFITIKLFYLVLLYFYVLTGVYTITNVQPQADGQSSKVKVKVRVNNNGMFTVQSASMIEKIEKPNDQEPESMETDSNNDKNGESDNNKSEVCPSYVRELKDILT